MTPEQRIERLEARLTHIQEQITILADYIDHYQQQKNP